MTASDVTKGVISGMSRNDNYAAGNDNNEAESYISDRTGTEKLTKYWWISKGVTHKGHRIRIVTQIIVMKI